MTRWCQPMSEGRPTPRTFLVRFEDAEMGDAVFTDEAEARDFWRRATVNWNCYLFAAMSLDEST